MVCKSEILAPAGSYEQLLAAVRCGADAVYLGSKKFSARQNAVNFDNEEVKTAIDYCHINGVKVYAALNTILSDKELSEALGQAEFLTNAGIDAFIVQDIALAKEIKKHSSVPLHASTQMSVGTADGFKVLKELGFVRAVLPRELSFEEIKKIVKNCDIETELFVHGALCMSVSGQCYMSAMLGSRSGNRGLCAQPCRLPFGRGRESDRFLSLKDLSLVKRLTDLQSIGVTSFKIEGRMKRAQYVAAAVTACRQSLDGALENETVKLLSDVFSRSGFTEGHFLGVRDKTMFGIRQKEDVEKSASSLDSLKQLYEKEIPTVPVSFKFEARRDSYPLLSAKAKNKSVTVTGELKAQEAVNKNTDSEAVASQLSKCGGTAFYSETIECNLDEGIFIPVSQINSMRRQALSQLQNSIVSERKYTFCKNSENGVGSESAFNALHYEKKDKKIFALFPSLEKFTDGIAQTVYLPLTDCAKKGFDAEKYKSKVFAYLPRMFFGKENEIKSLSKAASENGVCGFLVGGLDGYACVKDLGKEIHTLFGMNVYSSQTAKALSGLGISHILLSPELTVKQIENISVSCKTGVFAYGRLPLMLTRACPMQNVGGCKECKNPVLIDRKHMRFPLRCGFGFTEILNSRPIYMADKLSELKCDYLLLYFTTESKDEIIRIMESYKNGAPPIGEYTRGLFYRGSI